MIGGSAHSAPAGGFGGAARLGGACGTSMLKARWRPSGDHRSPLGDSVSCVSAAVSPVSIQRRWIWPSAVYASRVPSGDQRGEPPVPSRRWSEPSASMIQSSERLRSRMMSIEVRT